MWRWWWCMVWTSPLLLLPSEWERGWNRPNSPFLPPPFPPTKHHIPSLLFSTILIFHRKKGRGEEGLTVGVRFTKIIYSDSNLNTGFFLQYSTFSSITLQVIFMFKYLGNPVPDEVGGEENHFILHKVWELVWERRREGGEEEDHKRSSKDGCWKGEERRMGYSSRKKERRGGGGRKMKFPVLNFFLDRPSFPLLLFPLAISPKRVFFGKGRDVRYRK